MPARVIRVQTAMTLLLSALAIVPAGCGGDEPAAVEQPLPQVDPRFVSAEALVAHYNQLASEAEIVDARSVMALYYAETDVHRGLIDVSTQFISMLEYDLAMWEQFGQGITPRKDGPRLARNQKPARITEPGDERAVVAYTNGLGESKALQLVKVGERWWISGYTLEHDPEVAPMSSLPEKFGGVLPNAAVAPSVTARIRNGEFATAAEADGALGLAIRQRFPDLFDGGQ